LLRKVHLGCRVISIGNIQAGGAGKTPLVALLAREASALGRNVCILTRGYGGKWETSGGVIAPGQGIADVSCCGDEAALLHEAAPRAWIGVGADRVGQFEKIRKQSPVPIDLVILDDGFQHFKIARDVNIVAMTSKTRSQALFRDWAGALRDADLLVWTKGDLRPYSGDKAMAKVRYRLPKPEAGAEQARLWLVTGVGDPEHVLRSVCEAGWEIVRHIRFPDHARYAQRVVRELIEAAKKAGCRVAITGKDWVKWRALGVLNPEVLVLEPEIVFEEGRELWSRLLWEGSS
jgi:tetraacyldisaccharide 4'-kinase